MRKLTAFINVTLDGFFADANGDMSWAHKDDTEWREFVAGNAKRDATLVFGRTTYELMVSYWPTPFALQKDPVVAERMNAAQKVVFSRTLEKVLWQNTTLVRDDMVASIRKMKSRPGNDMAILGSGSLVSQLAQEKLIDELQVVVNPLVLGSGKRLFEGVKKRLDLKLAKTQAFKNGNVLLCYEPM